MALHGSDSRFPRLRPVAVFLVGLLIGWWAIGWWLWPVTYTNSLPQDLRAAERDQYLLMTAESYNANQDLALAQERTATWPRDDLQKALSLLEKRLASENATQAAQVQALVSALDLTTSAAPTVAAATPAATSVATSAATAQATATSSLNLGTVAQRVCGIGLWVVLFLVGIAAVAVLWRRWQATHAGRPPLGGHGYGGPADADMAGGAEREAVTQWTAVDDDDQDGQAERAATPPWMQPASPAREAGAPSASPRSPAPSTDAAQPANQESAAKASWRPATSSGSASPAPASSAPAAPAPAAPARPAAAPGSGEPVKIGEYLAVYRMGEPDYDEAFDIHDSTGAYVGQCGLGLTVPVGKGNDQAAALQVWLWDTNDPDTQVKVLMSEAAYRDTALRDQLAGEHPSTPVRQRTEFELETYSLLLRGCVEKVDYSDQEPAYGIFAEMVVRLQALRKS